ncbi:MAG: DEAD/DEAH box helicase [Pseudomonadales bacterium]|nr:DEAD/DEAH box helicase [Pseudomonadales bacterium]NIX09065.1 DEAD/DEAH box helicase [Pseudomonadales bacterium]
MITTGFASLGIGTSVCRALAEIGYERPTPIQSRAIPELLAGRDLLGIAQTGTGKTAAFVLPILEMLMANRAKAKPRCPTVLILAPTRELAAQIAAEIASFARHTPVRHACIFGGVGHNPQIRTLSLGVEILVATPGRLLDLAESGHVDLGRISHLVLDEADRLMDMGFIRDVRRIIRLLPRDRQSLLFSATMPGEVAGLADEMLNRPVRVEVSPERVTLEQIEQGVLVVANDRKHAALQKLLFDPAVTRAIVFTRTKHGANRVAKKLDGAGIAAEVIHGNKSQNARTRALESFKSGRVWVLVATDIAARGIDVDGISHVINFELPHEPESYVHRIGRTARAGASGVAWSLVDPSEMKRLKAIEKLTKVRPSPLQIDLLQSGAEQGDPSESGGRRARHRSADAGRGSDRRGRRRSRRGRSGRKRAA